MSAERQQGRDNKDVFGPARSVSSAAPPVSPEEAAGLAIREYGLSGEIRRLVGERDQIFLLRTSAGAPYTLKVIHPAEDPAVTEFQTLILQHVARADPTLLVQRVVSTLDGQGDKPVVLGDGITRRIRLTTFLEGTIIRGLPPSDRRCRNLGAYLARLQTALDGFHHPADGHEIPWDIQHTMRQAPQVAELESATKRELMHAGLARFEHNVLPRLGSLREQVLHNDLSGDNVVVDPAETDRIAGILDFGDATRTRIACDVAVGAAYCLHDPDDVLAAALPFLEGFTATRPLLRPEVELLFDLIIARMVVRVGITEWRARRFPDNRDYILRTTPMTWRLLERLLAIPEDLARSRILAACRPEN